MPELFAVGNAPNAAVAPRLGRSLWGGQANATVNVIEPGQSYAERTNLVDLGPATRGEHTL